MKKYEDFILLNSKKNQLRNEQTFFTKKTYKWLTCTGKDLNITNHQRHANQNQNDTSPHAC